MSKASNAKRGADSQQRTVMRRFDGLRNGHKIPVRMVERVNGIPIWLSDIDQYIVVAHRGKQTWLSWTLEQARKDAGYAQPHNK